MQAVEAFRREKTRHRIGAAFDQHAAEALGSECREDCGWRELLFAARYRQDFHIGRQRRAHALRGDDQPAHAVADEQPRACRQPSARIDDHARRLRPGHPANGQPRVVGERGADADHDRVDQRAQSVKMVKAGGAVDVVGMAG